MNNHSVHRPRGNTGVTHAVPNRQHTIITQLQAYMRYRIIKVASLWCRKAALFGGDVREWHTDNEIYIFIIIEIIPSQLMKAVLSDNYIHIYIYLVGHKQQEDV